MKDLRNIIDDNNQAAAKAVVYSVQKPREDYTASNKLQSLVRNNQLTNEQEDNMLDYNVYQDDDAMDMFKEMLSDTNRGVLSDTDIITTLYNLLDFEESDYVICDGDGTVELLDMDTLQDILDD